MRIAWNDLGYGDVRAGGFTVCAPPGWEAMGMPMNPEAGNTGFRLQTEEPNQYASASISGEVRTSHEDALRRLGDLHSATCGQVGHELEYVALQGWPAAQVRDRGMPSACGACPVPATPPPDVVTVATAAAIASFVVNVRGQASDLVSSSVIADLYAIGRSISADSDLQPPSSAVLEQELEQLDAREFPNCP
jgi:hypothetical protein